MLRSLRQPEQLGQLWSPDGDAKLSLCTSAFSEGLVAAAAGAGVCMMSASGGLHQEVMGRGQHAGRVTGVAFSGPSALVSCGEDGAVLVWDLRSKQVGNAGGGRKGGVALACWRGCGIGTCWVCLWTLFGPPLLSHSLDRLP